MVEYVEVTLDDIAVANRLAAEVLGRTLDELPPQTPALPRAARRPGRPSSCEDAGARARADPLHPPRGARPHGLELPAGEASPRAPGGAGVRAGAPRPRGQSFVYELLWDGGGADGEAFMTGLIDVEEPEENQRYGQSL